MRSDGDRAILVIFGFWTVTIFGKNDVIKSKHIKKLNKYLTNSTLMVLNNHTHDSYIINNDLLAENIIDFIKK